MFTIYQPPSPKHVAHLSSEDDLLDPEIVTKLQHHFYIDIAPPGYDWGKCGSPLAVFKKGGRIETSDSDVMLIA